MSPLISFITSWRCSSSILRSASVRWLEPAVFAVEGDSTALGAGALAFALAFPFASVLTDASLWLSRPGAAWTSRSCGLPSSLNETYGFFQHLALVLVRQRAERVREQKPAHFLHFVIMVVRIPAEVFHQKQVHRLDDTAAIGLGVELIGDLAQLPEHLGVEPGLLANLPDGGLFEIFPLFNPTLRQGPRVPIGAGHPDQGHLVACPGRSEDDATRRDAVDDHGTQYWIRAWTSQPSSCSRPLSEHNSTRKASPTISPPSWRTRLTVAAAVPPVASRSSTMSTRSPMAIASRCTASELEPYSRLYLTSKMSAGSLPGFRTGTKPALS